MPRRHQEVPVVASSENTRSILVRPQEKRPEQTPLEYLRYFRRVVDANQWTDNEAGKVFAALLGSTETVLDSFNEAWSGLNDLERLLRDREVPLREANLERLMDLKIGNHESPNQFRDRCVHLVSLVYENFQKNDQLILARDHFLFGIPDVIRRQVLMGRPKSLEEVVSLTSALTVSDTGPGDLMTVSKAKPDGRTDQLGRYRRSGFKTESHGLTPRRVDCTCFRCGRKGHIAKNCWQILECNQSPENEIRCVQQGGQQQE